MFTQLKYQIRRQDYIKKNQQMGTVKLRDNAVIKRNHDMMEFKSVNNTSEYMTRVYELESTLKNRKDTIKNLESIESEMI